MQVITAEDRKLAAEQLLRAIEGLEEVLSPKSRAFVVQMKRAPRVSHDQLQWLAAIREECLGA